MAQITSVSEWRAAHAQLLTDEAAAFQAVYTLNTRRQQMPMVEIENPTRFTFDGLDGTTVSLVDLFSGRRQLIIYNFMLYDNSQSPCRWCSFNMDNVPAHLEHLHSRDTSFVVTAPARIDKIRATKERMGWTFPFYSSSNTMTNAMANAEEMTWNAGKEFTGYTAFYREGDRVFHTYTAGDQATERTMATIALLDMTKLGRQDNLADGTFPLRDSLTN